jgi:hypothetical protein
MQLKKTLIFLACMALLTSIAWGVSSQTGKMESSNLALIIDTDTYLDINSLLCFVYNDGNFAYDNANILNKTDGLYFPRGTKKTVIYASGLWIGAKVGEDTRLAIAEFSSEYTPGPMADGTYLPDNASFRVYKIQRGDNAINNPDYAAWPYEMGAPIIRDENGDPILDNDGNVQPQLFGDQMCWAVYNDANADNHANDAGNTDPLGLEIQQSTFAYGRAGALGQVIFLKYLLINKGGNTLDSTYISLWADPDLGGASDDLVGCDTVLSMGFCYNEAGADNSYGTTAPAVGFDFFEGPLVDGEPTDSGLFQGEWIYGKKNLPMTSFNKYINGTDPHSTTETYNYMKGLLPNGDRVVDDLGDTTYYQVAGDPVAGTGWLDDAAADRRYMMSSGPFTMLPGDTQEVVAAIVVGQGGDRLSSITEMRTVDAQAQIVFDLNFDIPAPPPTPIVHARAYDGAIDLVWAPAEPDSNWPEAHYQDYLEALGEFYIFEGYNVYQGESQSGPWTKVGIYDNDGGAAEHTFGEIAGEYIYFNCDTITLECDSALRPWDFTKIYADVVNNDAGGIEKVITQSGDDVGTINHLFIETSYLDGGPIINNRPYYFAIVPYSVNIQQVLAKDSVFIGPNFVGFGCASLEGSKQPVIVVPKSSGATLIDTAIHATGLSQGMVTIEYLNYTDTEAANYEVTFNEDATWNLHRGTTALLLDQTNQAAGYDYEVVDGLMVRVMGPDAGVLSIVETATAAGPVSPEDNVYWSFNSTGDFYVSSDQSGSGTAARARFNWRGLMEWESWEFRFVEEGSGSEYYNFNTDELFYEEDGVTPAIAPFEVWHFTADDAEPDRRIIFAILDDEEPAGWSAGDRIYLAETEYSEPHPVVAPYIWDDDFHLGRIVFNSAAPAAGTVVRFNSTIPNTSGDSFTFTTKPVGSGDGTAVAKSLEDVLVVPNPYYNFSALESDQFDRLIKFTNLPPTECTIKIFNIAGDLVRELIKDNITDAEFLWDVKTESGLYVASGIYVYYIEAEGVGNTFGKMIVFTEVEQLDTY